MHLLIDSGIVPSPPRALLNRPQDASKPRLARIHAHLQFARESCDAAYSRRSEFISENSQIASVHAFMESLPVTLRG